MARDLAKGKLVPSFDIGNKNSTWYPCSPGDHRPTTRESIDYSFLISTLTCKNMLSFQFSFSQATCVDNEVITAKLL